MEVSIEVILLISLCTVGFGILIGWVTYRVYKNSVRKGAELEGQELIQAARDRREVQELEEKERIAEIEEELWSKVEADHADQEERIEELEDRFREGAKKYESVTRREQDSLKALEQDLKKQESKIQSRQQKLSNLKDNLLSLNKKIQDSILSRLQENKSELVGRLSSKMVEEAEKSASIKIRIAEENSQMHSEALAKHYLSTAIDRFQRPYCAERGIPSVFFQNPNDRHKFKDEAVIASIEELCGCDIHIDPENDQIGVAGFDPVRRELTHRVLEKILSEKRNINTKLVQQIVQQCRGDLVKKIKTDGDQVARELSIQGLHPEIKQMMGSLRYRYSFTQNQYFHCAEVGWLCGLLAAELGEDLPSARRSGLLHDLGKSMDHAKEGGHAVIGADFIQERGEKAAVVHAVRAHHFDVQPTVSLDFLVIAADAVSGGRPGARRSTVESYTQKVNELDQIAKSFPGVTDCYVLNGGREVRIMVNSKHVDDSKALKISQDMAKRVEEECNYPGQIKIVVVRETLAVESTMSR